MQRGERPSSRLVGSSATPCVHLVALLVSCCSFSFCVVLLLFLYSTYIHGPCPALIWLDLLVDKEKGTEQLQLYPWLHSIATYHMNVSNVYRRLIKKILLDHFLNLWKLEVYLSTIFLVVRLVPLITSAEGYCFVRSHTWPHTHSVWLP